MNASPEKASHNLIRTLFFVAIGALLIIYPLLSAQVGINGDEKWQAPLSDLMIDYYASFGEDTSYRRDFETFKAYKAKHGIEKTRADGMDKFILDADIMADYGGGFEVPAGLIAHALGFTDDEELGFHVVRHVLLALISVGIILFVGLITKEIAGWRAALIAALLLAVVPRFIGHGIMNPKDIPFAFAYAMSAFFFIRYFKTLPKPSWGTVIGVTLGLAYAINTRTGGGLLLFAYFGLFLAVWVGYKMVKEKQSLGALVPPLLKTAPVILIAGYFLGLVFWPYGLEHPFTAPFDALARQSDFAVNISQLFEGEQVMSKELPNYYLPKYILITLPLVALAGLLLAIPLIYLQRKALDIAAIGIILFMTVFPVFYIIYSDANVYGAWRHALFVLPMLMILSGLGWHLLIDRFTNVKPALKWAGVALVVLLSLEAVVWTAQHHPYGYMYFNVLVGGTQKAYQQYTTDYWMLGAKPASRWLHNNRDLSAADSNDPIIIGTNTHYPVKVYFAEWNPDVKVKYVRWRQRHQVDWDYGIFYLDYLPPEQLAANNPAWPPDQSIYVKRVGEVPIFAVIDRSDKSDLKGMQALSSQKLQQAMPQLQQAINTYPNSEFLRTAYATGLMQAGQFDRAITQLTKAAQLNPADPQVFAYLGKCYELKGDATMANQYYLKANKLQGK